MNLEGVLPVMKPAGMTSHDVVARVRRLLSIRRIGHTGTLDPQVRGVLPLCVGRATRIVEYIQELPKTYEAVLVIGVATDTEDATGEVVEQVEKAVVHEDELKRVLDSFIGEISQIPPMYSAVRVDGKRLYELARQGKTVERKSRNVTIHSIELLSSDVSLDHPEIRFRVTCSKGTYIRTLCADIGKKLGFPAMMKQLIRTASGNVHLDQCYTLEEIEQAVSGAGPESLLIPTSEALAHMDTVTVTSEQAKRLTQGQTVRLSDISGLTGNEELVKVCDQTHRFIGIFRVDSESNTLRAEKVFA